MTFCGNCGKQVQDGVKFCSSCGQTTGAPPAQPQYGGQDPAYTQLGAPQADIQDAQENKTMAILAYIFFFIPLLTGAHKTSAFAKFHTNQGTALFLAALIWGVAYSILSAILIFIPIIGWLLIFLIGLTGFVFLAFCVVGIINAANGRCKPLPVIGGINIIK